MRVALLLPLVASLLVAVSAQDTAADIADFHAEIDADLTEAFETNALEGLSREGVLTAAIETLDTDIQAALAQDSWTTAVVDLYNAAAQGVFADSLSPSIAAIAEEIRSGDNLAIDLATELLLFNQGAESFTGATNNAGNRLNALITDLNTLITNLVETQGQLATVTTNGETNTAVFLTIKASLASIDGIFDAAQFALSNDTIPSALALSTFTNVDLTNATQDLAANLATVAASVNATQTALMNLDSTVDSITPSLQLAAMSIVTVGSATEQVEQEVLDLTANVSNVQALADSFDGLLTTLTADIGSFASAVSAFTPKLDTLTTDVTSLESNVGPVVTKLNDAVTAIDGFGVSVAALTTEFGVPTTDLAALATAVNDGPVAAVDSLQSSTATLEQAIDLLDPATVALVDDVASISTDVAGISTQLDGVETSLMAVKTAADTALTSAMVPPTNAAGLEAAVVGVNTSVAALFSDVAGINDKLVELDEALAAQVGVTMNMTVAVGEASDVLAALDTNITAVGTGISAQDTTLDDALTTLQGAAPALSDVGAAATIAVTGCEAAVVDAKATFDRVLGDTQTTITDMSNSMTEIAAAMAALKAEAGLPLDTGMFVNDGNGAVAGASASTAAAADMYDNLKTLLQEVSTSLADINRQTADLSSTAAVHTAQATAIAQLDANDAVADQLEVKMDAILATLSALNAASA